MLTLYLVRHGETEGNKAGILQGHSDTPLSLVGRRQAERTGESLSTVKFDAVYASDLGRARETAEEIMKRQSCRLVLDRRLREINLGLFQGHTDAECRSLWPAEHAAYNRDRLNYRRPGGESYRDVRDRLAAALADIMSWHEDTEVDHTVAIVSHGGVLRSTLSLLVGYTGEVIGNCSISVLRWDGKAWASERIGDVSHLGCLEEESTARES